MNRFRLTPRQFAVVFMFLYFAAAMIASADGSTIGYICIGIGTVASLIFAYNFAQLALKFMTMIPPMPPLSFKR